MQKHKSSAAWKWLIIAGTVLLLAGVILFACGMTAADWDFSRLETVRYLERTYTQGEEDIGAIELDLRNADIEVSVSASAESISLVYPVREGEEEKTVLTAEGGTLCLREQPYGFDLFSWQFSTPAARLVLPAAALPSLTLKTDNGDIAVNAAACSSAALKTDNGNITLHSLTCTGDLRAETDNGNISLHSLACTGTLTAKTDNGDIAGTGSLTAAGICMQSDVGNIDAELLSAPSIELRTDIGDIGVTVAGAPADYTVTAASETGDCNLQNGGNGAKILQAHTDVGDIDVSFAG